MEAAEQAVMVSGKPLGQPLNLNTMNQAPVQKMPTQPTPQQQAQQDAERVFQNIAHKDPSTMSDSELRATIQKLNIERYRNWDVMIRLPTNATREQIIQSVQNMENSTELRQGKQQEYNRSIGQERAEARANRESQKAATENIPTQPEYTKMRQDLINQPTENLTPFMQGVKARVSSEGPDNAQAYEKFYSRAESNKPTIQIQEQPMQYKEIALKSALAQSGRAYTWTGAEGLATEYAGATEASYGGAIYDVQKEGEDTYIFTRTLGKYGSDVYKSFEDSFLTELEKQYPHAKVEKTAYGIKISQAAHYTPLGESPTSVASTGQGDINISTLGGGNASLSSLPPEQRLEFIKEYGKDIDKLVGDATKSIQSQLTDAAQKFYGSQSADWASKNVSKIVPSGVHAEFNPDTGKIDVKGYEDYVKALPGIQPYQYEAGVNAGAKSVYTDIGNIDVSKATPPKGASTTASTSWDYKLNPIAAEVIYPEAKPAAPMTETEGIYARGESLMKAGGDIGYQFGHGMAVGVQELTGGRGYENVERLNVKTGERTTGPYYGEGNVGLARQYVSEGFEGGGRFLGMAGAFYPKAIGDFIGLGISVARAGGAAISGTPLEPIMKGAPGIGAVMQTTGQDITPENKGIIFGQEIKTIETHGPTSLFEFGTAIAAPVVLSGVGGGVAAKGAEMSLKGIAVGVGKEIIPIAIADYYGVAQAKAEGKGLGTAIAYSVGAYIGLKGMESMTQGLYESARKVSYQEDYKYSIVDQSKKVYNQDTGEFIGVKEYDVGTYNIQATEKVFGITTGEKAGKYLIFESYTFGGKESAGTLSMYQPEGRTVINALVKGPGKLGEGLTATRQIYTPGYQVVQKFTGEGIQAAEGGPWFYQSGVYGDTKLVPRMGRDVFDVSLHMTDELGIYTGKTRPVIEGNLRQDVVSYWKGWEQETPQPVYYTRAGQEGGINGIVLQNQIGYRPMTNAELSKVVLRGPSGEQLGTVKVGPPPPGGEAIRYAPPGNMELPESPEVIGYSAKGIGAKAITINNVEIKTPEYFPGILDKVEARNILVEWGASKKEIPDILLKNKALNTELNQAGVKSLTAEDIQDWNLGFRQAGINPEAIEAVPSGKPLGYTPAKTYKIGEYDKVYSGGPQVINMADLQISPQTESATRLLLKSGAANVAVRPVIEPADIRLTPVVASKTYPTAGLKQILPSRNIAVPKTEYKLKESTAPQTGYRIETGTIVLPGQQNPTVPKIIVPTKPATITEERISTITEPIITPIQPQIITPTFNVPHPTIQPPTSPPIMPPLYPPIKFNMPEAGKKKKRKTRYEMPKFRMGGAKKNMLADIFSRSASEARYGRATNPSLTRRPGLWKLEGGPVPTVEMLKDKNRGRGINIGNPLKGLGQKINALRGIKGKALKSKWRIGKHGRI